MQIFSKRLRVSKVRRFEGQTALVTGGGSGVGRAIGAALATAGAESWLVGRDRAKLASAAAEIHAGGDGAVPYAADLRSPEQIRALAEEIEARAGAVDILVHAAAAFSQGPLESALVETMDEQYETNLRAPFLLTQALLCGLKDRAGWVVFVNSSVGLRSGAGTGVYAASKHGLRAVADSLRAEVNEAGVRVLSLFLGRTATPLQEKVCQLEGRDYVPDRLIQPPDVADIVLGALALPRTAEVTDLHLRPGLKPAS